MLFGCPKEESNRVLEGVPGIPTPFPTVGRPCARKITRLYRDISVVSRCARTPEFNGFSCSRTLGLRAGSRACSPLVADARDGYTDGRVLTG